MDQSDDLEEYLRGDTALSRRYKRESSPAPPHVLDRRVLRLSRQQAQRTAQRLSPCLQPLAFAACVLLSVALVLAMVFGPQAAKRMDDNTPRLVRVAARTDVTPNVSLNRRSPLYASDLSRARPAKVWLADIAALRRAGRNDEADAEYRRFRSAYPGYVEIGGTDHTGGALVIRP
jgi:negative regulator of sigma E activity